MEGGDRFHIELQAVNVVIESSGVLNLGRDERRGWFLWRRISIRLGQDLFPRKVHHEHVAGVLKADHGVELDRSRAVGEGTLTDGTRTIKLYTMVGFEHTGDMLMVYLPREKILAEADAYSPPEKPTTPLIAPKVQYAAALYDNIHRLKLNVETIAPFHGARTTDVADVARQSGGTLMNRR